jgi:hypothetical protein
MSEITFEFSRTVYDPEDWVELHRWDVPGFEWGSNDPREHLIASAIVHARLSAEQMGGVPCDVTISGSLGAEGDPETTIYVKKVPNEDV